TTRARRLSPAGRQFAHVAGATRSVTAETCQPMCKIDIVAAQPALDDHSRDLSSLLGMAELGCGNCHARKPGWQPEPPKPPADARDAPRRVECFELSQLLARGLDGRGRRRIDPRQRARIGCAPLRAVEQ